MGEVGGVGGVGEVGGVGGGRRMVFTNHQSPITNPHSPIYLTLNLLAVANKSCAIPVKRWKTLAIS